MLYRAKHNTYKLRLQFIITVSNYQCTLLEKGTVLPFLTSLLPICSLQLQWWCQEDRKKAMIKQCKRNKITPKRVISTQGTLRHAEAPETFPWKGKATTSQLSSYSNKSWVRKAAEVPGCPLPALRISGPVTPACRSPSTWACCKM